MIKVVYYLCVIFGYMQGKRTSIDDETSVMLSASP